MNFGIESMDLLEVPEIVKPTTLSILEGMDSCIGLDVAKNHTGICYREGGIIKRTGFLLSDYDVGNPHAEYNMRKEFKSILREIVSGKQFKYAVIEDVYGGKNFDTVRKLLALNTVIDELIDERVVEVENFFRFFEPVWLKHFRKYYKVSKKPTAKVETQTILEFLEDEFYLENKDLSNADKERIFFEDICDATAMLCSIPMYLAERSKPRKFRGISMKDIALYYVEDRDDYMYIDDDRVQYEPIFDVEPVFRSLESKILDEVSENPDLLKCMELPVRRLGKFGDKYGLPYYSSGRGYLIWYLK